MKLKSFGYNIEKCVWIRKKIFYKTMMVIMNEIKLKYPIIINDDKKKKL